MKTCDDTIKNPTVVKEFEKYIVPEGNPNRKEGNLQTLYRFENGYGASVIFGEYSYGLELAVIKFNKHGKFYLVVNTPITDEYIGYLNKDKLINLLERIRNL